MRGYDQADEVRLQNVHGTGDSRPDQRAALHRWRVYHDLDVQGLLSQAPQALWPGSPEGCGWLVNQNRLPDGPYVPLLACRGVLPAQPVARRC